MTPFSLLQSMTQVLYHLAERPDLHAPLREEIEAAIEAEGWTMPSLARMWKLDSLLRESERCNGVTLGEPLLPFPSLPSGLYWMFESAMLTQAYHLLGMQHP